MWDERVNPERDLIRERTNAGLAAARARGRTGGRPRAKGLDDSKKLALARALHEGRQTDVATICDTLGVSRATLYRYLKPSAGESLTRDAGHLTTTKDGAK